MLSYVVSWDEGLGGEFVDLSGHENNDLRIEQIYVDGVQSGVYYTFKYRARNVHGEGPDSDPFTILAATKPNQMQAPSVDITTDVKYQINVVEPFTGGDSVVILEYEVQLMHASGEFRTPTACLPANSNVVDTLNCVVELDELT